MVDIDMLSCLCVPEEFGMPKQPATRRQFLKRSLLLPPTAAAIASLPRTKPFFEQRDIFVERLYGIREYRIPSIVTTNGDTLVVVCDARVEKPGDAPNNIDLVFTRSVDKGLPKRKSNSSRGPESGLLW